MIAESASQEAHSDLIQLFMVLAEKATESEALFFLELNSYNIDKAITSYFDSAGGSLRLLRKNIMGAKYLKYLKAKGGLATKKQSMLDCLNRTVRRFTQQLRLLWKELAPSTVRGLFPGELFHEQYGVSLHWVNREDACIEDCFKRCYETGKPLVIYEFNQDFIQNVMTVFTIQTAQLLNWQFLTIGIGSHDTQMRDFLRRQCRLPEQTTHSTLSVFRVDQCQEVVLVSHLMITEAVTAIQAFNFFQDTLAVVTEEKALEAEVAREVELGFKGERLQERQSLQSPSSHISDINNDSGLMEPEQEPSPDWIIDKELRQAQQEQFRNSQKEHERRRQAAIELKLAEEKEQKEFQLKVIERKTRKISQALEPQQVQNKQIITLGFRLPRGGRILRRFCKTATVQEIFDYVELNQQVEFENERDRYFDLLTISDNISLASKKQNTIGDVFGDQIQETLLVKEL